jgi:hypothetical protein
MPHIMTTSIRQFFLAKVLATAVMLLFAVGCARQAVEPEASAEPVTTTAEPEAADAPGIVAAVEPLPEQEPEPMIESIPQEEAKSRPMAVPTGDVIWIQRRLKDLGYYAGPIDGDAGGATRRAIREYQADQGLAQTGMPTPELQDFMWRNGG